MIILHGDYQKNYFNYISIYIANKYLLSRQPDFKLLSKYDSTISNISLLHAKE